MDMISIYPMSVLDSIAHQHPLFLQGASEPTTSLWQLWIVEVSSVSERMLLQHRKIVERNLVVRGLGVDTEIFLDDVAYLV